MIFFVTFSALLLITLIFFLVIFKKEKEKNLLFHIMTHRFRSPASVIKWYIELLSDKSVGNLNDKQKKYLSEIYNASDRLNETLDSLVILLQLESGNLAIKTEKVDIESLIGKIIQKFQFKIERHRFNLQEIYPKEQEAIIQTDSKLLNIALQNLIENAMKYTPENGNINIKVDFFNSDVLIEIKGSGNGILKEEKSGILANTVNFRDADFNLHLVKLILKRIKAKANFKSEENKETIFSIYLPAST
jgi:signal transduction histidine kinase